MLVYIICYSCDLVSRDIKHILRNVRVMFGLQFQGKTNSCGVLQGRKGVWISVSNVWGVRNTEESGIANVWVWGEHDTIHMYW